MNKLSREERVAVVKALVEGNSIRSIERMTGIQKKTITRLLEKIGAASAKYQDMKLRNLQCRRIQCDEIWSFVYAKAKNVPASKKDTFGYGDVWTWTAIDADTKLAVSWLVGLRDTGYAVEFMRDLASRLSHRVQLTTDGHKAYLVAVEDAFGGEIDFAQLVKVYGPDKTTETRYSPPQVVGCTKTDRVGIPDPKHVSTSYVERANLTMRMAMRRFTRLTNAFSKKIENHAHAVSLHFMHYNFVRVHQTLRITPAMAAGVTGKLWEIADVVALLPK